MELKALPAPDRGLVPYWAKRRFRAGMRRMHSGIGLCPLPEKAVLLEEARVQTVDRGAIAAILPHVLRDRCIGCGVCEHECRVGGAAAIRDFITSEMSPA